MPMNYSLTVTELELITFKHMMYRCICST